MLIGIGILTLVYIIIWGVQNTWVIVKYTSSTVVQALQDIQNLQTTEMTMTKIVEWEDELLDLFPSIGIDDMIQNTLFKDKMVLEVEWTVTAGYDLNKINTGDIKVFPAGILSINLPEAEILSVTLSDNTKPFTRELWRLTKWNVQLETELRNQAKILIKQDALNQWILDHADDHIKKLLREQFEKSGLLIHTVIIKREWVID